MKASFIATAFAATFLAQAAPAADLIEEPGYADKVAGYIVKKCPRQLSTASKEELMQCTKAGTDSLYTIATKMLKYIDGLAYVKPAFSAGNATGDILQNCVRPLEEIGGQHYSSVAEFYNAAFDATNDCARSLKRAGNELSVNYEPTARNVVLCHMNRLGGRPCEPAR